MAAGGNAAGGVVAGRYFTHQYQRDSADPTRLALCRITRVDLAAKLVYYQADVRNGKRGDPLMTSVMLFREVSFGQWADPEATEA